MPDLTAPGEPIVLAGRSFHFADFERITFANDLYVERALKGSGFADAFRSLAATPELDRHRATVLVSAYSSGHLPALLAGVLHEDGVKWSEEVAVKNARFFADLDTRRDRDTLYQVSVVWISSFFLNGLASSTISPSSLSGAGPEFSDPANPATSPLATAAPSTSDHGTASS